MSLIAGYFRELFVAVRDGWNRFWFAPRDPATLGLIRVLAGCMLLYTHLVWTVDLEAFFGPGAWVNREAAASFYTRPPEVDAVGQPFQPGAPLPEFQPNADPWYWSYLWYIESPAALWTAHIAAIVVLAMFASGLFSRATAVLAFIIAVSYVNRVPGTHFGLDQINVMLVMYLMLGPSGDAYSLDRLWQRRRLGRALPMAAASTSGNIAIRLMQLHMCVIYFFAGLSKLQGESWWRGDALWGAIANLEYQTLDVTWLSNWPVVIALMTTVTVYWELSFCVLVWPRITRPLVLALAVPLHLGIALGMGMITFGLVMLIGCTSFVPSWLVRRVFDRNASNEQGDTPAGKAGQGRGARLVASSDLPGMQPSRRGGKRRASA